jgi:hypothetical protein
MRSLRNARPSLPQSGAGDNALLRLLVGGLVMPKGHPTTGPPTQIQIARAGKAPSGNGSTASTVYTRFSSLISGFP